ncbi:MAG TPA: hypothetical protein VJJ82_00380 [Candidatus Nanoarchaeia archaeon]|nr:hypothetical protein [Candidatus Nanoarchaeia archaeon]
MQSELLLKELLDNVSILIKNAEEKMKADASTPAPKEVIPNEIKEVAT